MSLRDIKDKSPNQAAVDLLEKALAQAKSGELRSCVLVEEFDDGSTNHHWSIDKRSYRRMILAEIVMAQHDFTVNIELGDGDSVLAEALR